jgi:hypothetical protein
MLGKWVWRLKSFPNLLWSKVILAIHGPPGPSSLLPLQNIYTGPWKDMVSIQKELSSVGITLTDLIGANMQFYPTKEVRFNLDAKCSVYSDAGSFSWNRCAPPKANLFLWRASQNAVATRAALARRGAPIQDISCCRCQSAVEDNKHLLLGCIWAKAIWWHILRWLRIPPSHIPDDVSDLGSFHKGLIGSKKWKQLVQVVVFATCWKLWLARNEKLFKGSSPSVMSLVKSIKFESIWWVCNRSKIGPVSWDNWSAFDIANIV